jgi:DNA-binding ferritin-like protein
MTLQDLMQAIDYLSKQELHQLRQYIDEREKEQEKQTHPARGATPQERVRRLQAAAAAIREGLTREELDEMTAAMNAEYIEPFDEDVWKD